MSAELYPASRNNASLQSTAVGGSKPLHRFIKGQPKIVGIIVLVLGSSFFIVSVATISSHIRILMHPGIWLGILFITSGILYIVTEHNLTKKTVTVSLAFSIVTLLGTIWTLLDHFLLTLIPRRLHSYYRTYEMYDDNGTEVEEVIMAHEAIALSVEVVWIFHNVAGLIIFIVMASLATAALRSTKNQAVIVMTTSAAETPVE